MKIFRTVRKTMKLSGITPNRVSCGLYELKHISQYVLSILLVFLYPYNRAGTVTEYMEAILMCVIAMLVLVVYLSYKFKSQAIFEVLDRFEEIINTSEYELQNLRCAHFKWRF